nr:outer membrane beta-barrel protein [Enterovirga sp. DB1703]
MPRRRAPEEDPFASLGIRVGGLTLFPAIEQSIGYDTNPNRTQQRKGSFVSHTEGELRLQSDWSRHELSGFLRGAYNEYPAVPEASRPEGSGRVGLRLDVLRDTQINIEGRYLIDTQRPDSPDLASPVKTRPLIFSEGGTLGLTHRFNRLVASLQGTIDRTDYENARTPSGILIDQSDRNVTQYGIRGRLGYEITPGFIPFVEALADTRVYDRRIDNAGFRRSSDGIGGRAGTTFEITRLITGEIAAGAINRRYDDPRLGDLTSPLVDASLVWAVTPLTTIKATASAAVDETTVPDARGVQTIRGLLEVSHALRRYLIVTGGLTISDYDYQGAAIHERGYGALVRAEYKLNRSVALRASYNWERLTSSIAGSSYTANVFLVGMRYQP